MSLLKRLADHAGLARELERSERFISRRKLLFGAGLLAASQSKEARAVPPPANTRLLIDRLTMGWTPAEQLLADTLGYHGYLEYHLDYESIDDDAMDTRLAPYDLLDLEPFQLLQGPGSRTMNQLIEATMLRGIYSKRQLFERMVEFWLDHFHIDLNKDKNPSIKPVDDREVARAHALGTFPALLHASAHSPSMAVYLDNFTSTAGQPNENYARELLELHTMGVDGGYTQQDVVEVARCFTGWSVYDGFGGELNYTFLFKPSNHDNGAKVVLGNPIPANGGYNDGLIVLDILVNHPSTAQFIAGKLCRRFWGYDPPQTLVDAVAATFTSTQGDIKAMLRTLWTTLDPASATPKLKRPYHMIISALRATDADFPGDPTAIGSALRNQTKLNSHELFQWITPDGYPDRIEAWVATPLPRWNFAEMLSRNQISGVTIDVDALLGPTNTAQQVADRIDEKIFGGLMPAVEKNEIVSYVGEGTPPAITKQEALGLALSAPSFQWY